ncbi:hypothetical protein CC1G_10775 [Coprinopsis cinerea okayama7|uniref:Uncharacterized protein n=1 Tax=Coprinopsis cinerea (strain Okayama-7 / 130 / ATCC MYA-4618 / FGSC 9003) TaxID=240176 RepID=A8NMF0_COPC7|nr:hypothetical protein CC1G_10775 [Coprinopsis cinerea okayama7\|eukprot:XP_001834901.2 hypothetical protein CC1G_10775 [Coprinopsis cinerea okayama7\
MGDHPNETPRKFAHEAVGGTGGGGGWAVIPKTAFALATRAYHFHPYHHVLDYPSLCSSSEAVNGKPPSSQYLAPPRPRTRICKEVVRIEGEKDNAGGDFVGSLGRFFRPTSSEISLLIWFNEAANARCLLERVNGTTHLIIHVGHHPYNLSYLLGNSTSISATSVTHYAKTKVLDGYNGKPTGEVLPGIGTDHLQNHGHTLHQHPHHGHDSVDKGGYTDGLIYEFGQGGFVPSSGRLQEVGGVLYYSPNCDRTLTFKRDPFSEAHINPFQPEKHRPLQPPRKPSTTEPVESTTSPKFVQKYPRFEEISSPRLWTPAFGWLAFAPLKYSDPGYPFNRLKRIPLPSIVGSPDNFTYQVPDNFAQSWAKLESELYGAVTKLKCAFSPPMVLPFLPWAHGYLITFKNPRSYDRAVASSRDWFAVWWGALSYLIAYGESRRDAFTLKSFVPQWHLELRSEVDSAWVDGIWFSSICDFSYNSNRIGCIIDIVNPAPNQPSLQWFLEHGVPVWYRWGPSERASADQRFAPPPGTLTWRPERPLPTPSSSSSSLTRRPEGPRPTPSSSSSSLSTDASSSSTSRYQQQESARSRFQVAWAAHCAQHERAHARILEKETAADRQAREARAANPPVSKVRVYEWSPSEKDPDTYERVPAGVKYSRDTLALYSSKQKIFDAFCREWDCCDLLGDGEEEIDTDEWTPEDLALPLPNSLRNKIAEAYDLCLENDDEEEGILTSTVSETQGEVPPPSAYHPLHLPSHPPEDPTTIVDDEQGVFVTSTNWLVTSLTEEVNHVFGLHYGFVAPLPSVPVEPQANEKDRKAFFRLLGLTDIEDKPEEYFSTAHYHSAVRFMTALSLRKAPHGASWDLKDDVIDPLKHSSRLPHLRIAPIPHFENIDMVDRGLTDCVPRYYYFDFPSSKKNWKLAVLNAMDALFVCRLCDKFTEDEIVFTLVQKGVSFRLFMPRRHLRPSLYQTPSYSPLPVRPLKHKFTKADYDSYINTRTLVLSQPHMKAALRRGGIIWRLAIATLGMGDAQREAVGCGSLITTNLQGYDGEYVDDGLTARELDLICGAYKCIDERTGQVAMKSWWPLARAYERADCGENYGRWCCRREEWYLRRLDNIERGVDKFNQPLAFQEWKSAQRGLGAIRSFHQSLESSSHEFIERNILSRSVT